MKVIFCMIWLTKEIFFYDLKLKPNSSSCYLKIFLILFVLSFLSPFLKRLLVLFPKDILINPYLIINAKNTIINVNISFDNLNKEEWNIDKNNSLWLFYSYLNFFLFFDFKLKAKINLANLVIL